MEVIVLQIPHGIVIYMADRNYQKILDSTTDHHYNLYTCTLQNKTRIIPLSEKGCHDMMESNQLYVT